MRLSQKTIKLDKISENQLPRLAQLANNVRIASQLRDFFPHPYGLREAYRFYQLTLEENPRMTFGIQSGGELCGIIGLTPRKGVYRHSAELGYWIGEPYWGQGLATRAVRSVIRYAFDTLKLHKLSAEVFATNPASMRVLEKNGFEKEGVLLQGAMKNDQLLDVHVYGLIRSG